MFIYFKIYNGYNRILGKRIGSKTIQSSNKR